MATFTKIRTHITHSYIHWKAIITGPCHCPLTSSKRFLQSKFCQVRYCYVSANIPIKASTGQFLELQEISRDTYWIRMYCMDENGYFFFTFVMHCLFQSKVCHFVFLLCSPDLAFFYPFLSFHISIDNNHSAICVDMPFTQEGSACHTSHHHTEPQCAMLIYRCSVSPWCLDRQHVTHAQNRDSTWSLFC